MRSVHMGEDSSDFVHDVSGDYSIELGTCPDNSNSPRGSSEETDCVCNAGSAGPDGGECILCEAGSYTPHRGITVCALCPAGTHSTVDASTSVSDCAPCGAYSSSPNGSAAATACTCNAGYTESGGACEPCSQNSYKDSQGDGACSACGVGRMTAGTGALDVSQCVCAAGYYKNGGSCASCPANSWCEGGVQLSCPSGATSPLGSDAITDCTCSDGGAATEDGCRTNQCSTGQYWNSSQCQACPAGKWCRADTLQPCPLNSTSEANSGSISACACDVGHYSGGTSSCVACVAGHFCSGGVLQSCPGESTSPALSRDISDCSCNAGYSGS
eukprot:836795-Rhodomonas_salina.2